MKSSKYKRRRFRSPSKPTISGQEEEHQCSSKWIPLVHESVGGCHRCLELATTKEKERFIATGYHYRIMRTQGGCARTCEHFARKIDEPPVRLCRYCFYSTHRISKEEELLGEGLNFDLQLGQGEEIFFIFWENAMKRHNWQ